MAVSAIVWNCIVSWSEFEGGRGLVFFVAYGGRGVGVGQIGGGFKVES